MRRRSGGRVCVRCGWLRWCEQVRAGQGRAERKEIQVVDKKARKASDTLHEDAETKHQRRAIEYEHFITITTTTSPLPKNAPVSSFP